MATYSNLGAGSRGEEVKKLQQALINAGYSVGGSGADGVYGNDTASAVRKYQQDNGLSVDGIAGSQTQGKLYSSPAASTQASIPANGSVIPSQQGGSQAAQGAQSAPDYSRYEYDPATNDAYTKALAALQAAQKELPTYAGTYDAQLNDIYNKIMNRDKFSYDMEADPMWQMYKDQYIQHGQMAMMDTMGQAAGLTGGYGNSYAQSVGQQAYNAYLQDLNAQAPALYGAALDAYTAEGDDMAQQFAMVGDLRNDEYGRYQDALDRYWQNLDYLKGEADDAYAQGYESWLDSYQMSQEAYSRLADQILMSGQMPSAEELAAVGMTSAEAARYRQAYLDGQATGGGGGGGGGGYSYGGGSDDSYDDGGASVSYGEVRSAAIDAARRGQINAAMDSVKDAAKNGWISTSQAAALKKEIEAARKGTTTSTSSKTAGSSGSMTNAQVQSALNKLKDKVGEQKNMNLYNSKLKNLILKSDYTDSQKKQLLKAAGLT